MCSRYVNVGLFYLRQLFFAKFDIKVHTDQGKNFLISSRCLFIYLFHAEGEDYTALWNTLRESISMVKGPEKFGPGQATFAHITGGYDAGYYGYVNILFMERILFHIYLLLTTIVIHTLSFSLPICIPLCSKRIHWTPCLDNAIDIRFYVLVGAERKLIH